NEAEKGYDFLVVGLGTMRTRSGAFHPNVGRIACNFDGPLAIVAANGIHLKQPEQSAQHILVPVNGSDVSRRASEVAIALARAFDAPISALYVSNFKRGARGRRRGGARARRQEQAILKDVVELADRYGQVVKTAVRSDVPPDEAILKEVARNHHNLIVMGVSQRPGDTLFFGETAAGILENSSVSIVFISS